MKRENFTKEITSLLFSGPYWKGVFALHDTLELIEIVISSIFVRKFSVVVGNFLSLLSHRYLLKDCLEFSSFLHLLSEFHGKI